jgi:hypothetical protein
VSRTFFVVALHDARAFDASSFHQGHSASELKAEFGDAQGRHQRRSPAEAGRNPNQE